LPFKFNLQRYNSARSPSSRSASRAAAADDATTSTEQKSSNGKSSQAAPAPAVATSFIGAIQRISVDGDRIIGNAIKSSGFIDEDSEDEEDGRLAGRSGRSIVRSDEGVRSVDRRRPAHTAAQRKTNRWGGTSCIQVCTHSLKGAWFQTLNL
jgi:hypothetical protein